MPYRDAGHCLAHSKHFINISDYYLTEQWTSWRYDLCLLYCSYCLGAFTASLRYNWYAINCTYLRLYNLVIFDIWNHCSNQGDKHTHHFQKFAHAPFELPAHAYLKANTEQLSDPRDKLTSSRMFYERKYERNTLFYWLLSLSIFIRDSWFCGVYQ